MMSSFVQRWRKDNGSSSISSLNLHIVRCLVHKVWIMETSYFFQRNLISLIIIVLGRNGMVFLCRTFRRQLLTVVTVMFRCLDEGRFFVRDKHVCVLTEKFGSGHTAEGDV